jgi:anti-sigma regulatory factor (Ser/Thr protein kinase)
MTHRRELELPGDAASISTARKFVVETSAQLGVSDDLSPRLALVVSELASNAVQASPGRSYDLAIHVSEHWLKVEITNVAARASIPDREQWMPGEPLAVRGRGLGIVDHRSDEVEIEEAGGKVTVTATLHLPVESP